MRERILPLVLALLLSACGNAAAEVIPTARPTEPVLSPSPTHTPEPTETATPQPPTATSEPTATATTVSTPTPDIPEERIEVAYEDRVIRGTLVGEGDIAVVLAPMFENDRSSWMRFADYLALQGYAALAFDFPGFGRSTGDFNFTATTFDALAVIDYLYEQGYQRIVCMGASIGASACFEAALLRPTLAGLVIIAAPNSTTAEEAAPLVMPKLFVSGNEPDVIEEMNKTYALVPPPKQFMTLFSENAHGTDLFNSDSKDEFRDLLVGFLESLE